MKKSYLVIFIFVIGIGCFLYLSKHEGFDIKIKNITNKKISGLKLDNPGSEIKIPPILPGEEYEFNVPTNGDIGESSMTLNYKDHDGKLHSIVVIGYYEKGYNGKALVTLKSVNDNGIIESKVNEEIKNYIW